MSQTPSQPSASLHVETSRALPLVSVSVAQRQGALGDAPGKEGTALLLSRLMRRTAGGRPAEAIDEHIDSMGASLDSDASHSVATVHGTVISRSLDAFTELLEELVARPSLDDEELGKLRRQVAASLVEARDNDRSLARRWFSRRMYAGHAYGRPIAGTLASLERVTAEDLRALHRQAWCADGLALSFSGDIEPEEAEQIAQRLRAALPQGQAPVDTAPDPTIAPGRRLVIVDKPERTQTQILIGTLGTHPSDEDHTALHVANTVFGGTFTARMTQEVRAKRGWSYGAYSSLPYDRRRRAFSMWTFPKADDAAACIQLELEMLEQWRERGITKRELAWAQRYLVRSHAFAVDTPAKRSGQALDAALYDLPPGYHERYTERVRAVTLDSVNAAVRRRISTEDLLVVVVATEKDIGAELRGCIADLAHTEVVSYDTDEG